MQQSVSKKCAILDLFDKKGSEDVKVIKRDGHMVDYSPEKIEEAIKKANLEVDDEEQASSVQIKNIIKYIEKYLNIFIRINKYIILKNYIFI